MLDRLFHYIGIRKLYLCLIATYNSLEKNGISSQTNRILYQLKEFLSCNINITKLISTCCLIWRCLTHDFDIAIHVGELVHLLKFRIHRVPESHPEHTITESIC